LQSRLVECAWAASRKKESYLKRKYESLVGRRGKKKALVAVGHKIIIAAYHVIKNLEAYQEPVLHDNNRRKQKKEMKYHLRKLKDLGIEINETEGRFFTEAKKVLEYEIDTIRTRRVSV